MSAKYRATKKGSGAQLRVWVLPTATQPMGVWSPVVHPIALTYLCVHPSSALRARRPACVPAGGPAGGGPVRTVGSVPLSPQAVLKSAFDFFFNASPAWSAGGWVWGEGGGEWGLWCLFDECVVCDQQPV